MASRMAISRRRAEPRASSRLATFRSDQQNEPGDQQKDQEERAHRHHLRLGPQARVSGDRRDTPVRVRVAGGHLHVHAPGHRREARARRRDRHAGLQARVDRQDRGVQVPRQIDVRRIAEADEGAVVFGENTYDGAGPAIEIEGVAHHRRIAAEVLLPETVAEHGDLVGVAGRNAAAVQHGNAECCEVVFGSEGAKKGAGDGAIVVVDDDLFILPNDIGKETAGGEEVDHFRGRVAVAANLHGNQRCGVGRRGLTEQKFHAQREHGSVHTDAESEGQQRREHEHRAAPQPARGVDQVAPEVLEESESP